MNAPVKKNRNQGFPKETLSVKEKAATLMTWCRWCDMPLQGRSDKRFCDIHCKNAWHLWINKFGMKGPIIRVITANSRIIQSFLNHGSNLVTMNDLIRAGFNEQFHTSVWTSPDGECYTCCFNFGFAADSATEKIRLIERTIRGDLLR